MKHYIFSLGMIAILFSITGCVNLKVAMGGKYDDPAEDLADNYIEITEMVNPDQETVFSKDKAYLTYSYRKFGVGFKGIFEVVNDKIEMIYYIDKSSNYMVSDVTGERRYRNFALAYSYGNSMGEEDGRYIMELTPGKHKFIQGTSCSPFTADIDMKGGYLYTLHFIDSKIESDDGTCLSPYYFVIGQGVLPEKSMHSNVYKIKSESKKIIDKAIADSTLPEKYILFKKNIDNIPKKLKYVFKQRNHYR